MRKKPRPDSGKLDAQLQHAWTRHQAGQLAQAEEIYRGILIRAPSHPDANNLMGLLCIQSKKPKQAEKYIRKALRTDPQNPQSHYNLGIACADQHRYEDAALHFSRASRLQPGNIDAISSHGNALRLAGKVEEAVKALRSATQRDPRNPGAKHNLGQALNDWGAALNKAGEADKAIEKFREALKFTPHHPQAHMNLGLSLEQSGMLEEAASNYQAAISARPDFADPHFYLAHLRTHRSTRPEIDAMRQLLENQASGHDDRIRLAYGLGFALESVSDYPEAFRYMSEAHRLQSQGSTFSLERETARFDVIRRIFSVRRLASMPGDSPVDDRPVLIAGMPRSGTTLAEQILASHPQVHGAGEQTALAEAAKLLAGNSPLPFPEGLEDLPEGKINAAAAGYLDRLSGGAGEFGRITDTTPMNFLLFGLAAIMLPGARFIHCLRDPMDNCLSIYRQYLTGPRGFEHNLRELGAYYRLHRELLDHWQQVLGGRLYVLQYEKMVTEPDHEIRKLLDFMDLPFDEQCLSFHQTGRVVRSPSAGQVHQPLYTSSIGAWRHYGEHLQSLVQALGDLLPDNFPKE